MTDQTPIPLPSEDLKEEEELSQLTINEAIEAASLEAHEVAQATAKVDLQFPAIGFIDPVKELEKMRQLSTAMLDDARRLYPEQIRAKLLAHHANPTTSPPVTDEELALAIFIKRTTDSALTPEELETKATGKATKKATTKTPKAAKPTQRSLDDILGGTP